ncbi:MAG: 30S ribosomal protein S6 [Saprospiraceae bacterium]|nr:30S ribosomal protein S6 [Saprospiraceae bacterium]
MKHFEVNFIVDPVLSDDEVKSTAQTYQEMLTTEGASIVHVDEAGLKPLAYPINKRSTGVYYCIEFSAPTGSLIGKMELAMKRDERIMRYLTVSLDKFGVKYNDDKRNGKIGKKVRKEKPVPVMMSKPYVPKAAIPEIIGDDLGEDVLKVDE